VSDPSDLGDHEDVEIVLLPDGRVRLHAVCKPGQDPAECEARIQAMVEALGVPAEGVERVVSQGEGDPQDPSTPSS